MSDSSIVNPFRRSGPRAAGVTVSMAKYFGGERPAAPLQWCQSRHGKAVHGKARHSKGGRHGSRQLRQPREPAGGRPHVRHPPPRRRQGAGRLPYSLRILLENLLRTEDGANVTAEHIQALASWDPQAAPSQEIQFTPARVIMQDFTGVPCIVDLAAMREAMSALGGDPAKINPWLPPSWSSTTRCIADVFGRPTPSSATPRSSSSATRSATSSCGGGRTAFDNFAVVPPNTGIVHQVNLE